jgi:type III pantothenate kinase
MSCLLVDQGNTRIKYAWRTETGIDPVGLQALDTAPSAVWLASVASAEARERLLADLGQRCPGGVKQASVPLHRRHLATRYVPEQLGVDRWLAMLACHERGEPRLLVVDSGTATTVDLLDAEQGHLGGYILPGFEPMQQALLGTTAIRLGPPNSDIRSQLPADTHTAIGHAGPLAVAAMIEHLRRAWGEDMLVMLGGGAAPQIQPLLDGRVERVEQLVLHGLAVLSRLEGD